jgi:N-acetylneuraminic acid mutarotase
MIWNRHRGVLLGLCTAIAACDSPTAPTEEPQRPEGVESSSLVAAASGWSKTASMARARAAAAAATIGSTIYVVGGTPSATGSDQGSTTTLQAYNTRTNTWSLRRPLPLPRAWFNGASVISGRIYVSGGYLANTLFVYNPTTDTWVRKADMPSTGGYGAQGAIGGKLYVYAGGYKFWRYDPATNRWTALPSPTWKHSQGGFGVIGGKLYLAGGEEDYVVHGVVEVYDPGSNRWTRRAPLPNLRSGMASAVLNGKLYVAGGQPQGGGGARAMFDVYHPASNTWSSKPPLPVARSHAAGAAAQGRVFVMGGRLDSGAATARVDAYTP